MAQTLAKNKSSKLQPNDWIENEAEAINPFNTWYLHSEGLEEVGNCTEEIVFWGVHVPMILETMWKDRVVVGMNFRSDKQKIMLSLWKYRKFLKI